MYSRALAYYLIHHVVAFAIFQQYKRRNPKKRGGITEHFFFFFFFFTHDVLGGALQSPMQARPSRSTAPIAFSIGTRKDILKAIGATERKGSGLRD